MSTALHDRLTLAEIRQRLTPEQYALLGDVRNGVVRSTRNAKGATVQAIVHGFFTTVTDAARAMEAAGLVRRAKVTWFLTPAGEALLNGRAGGAS